MHLVITNLSHVCISSHIIISNMDAVYQILTWVFSGTSLLGLVASIAYYKQTKRTKEAEAKQKEVEAEKAEVDVEKAKIDARKQEVDRLLAQIDHQQKTIDNLMEVNNNLSSRLSKLNADIDKHIDRRHELVDKLSESEQETNRVNTLLNEAKNDIIRLTEERDEERRRADHLNTIKCERKDCKDPRGPKPPRKNQKVATSDNEKTV